ncbi:hypothetical protein TrispH2_004239 [Trichoplax sp. H2]|nr:hypothetical protein TrispH2_004239 [Trichoplax sp. H2]|eukprot:RDD43988.1 hypothetical protein TrispH2_004239 [Trichoplax sp. H2]
MSSNMVSISIIENQNGYNRNLVWSDRHIIV